MSLFSGSMKQMHVILVSILLEVDFKRVHFKLLDRLHLLGIQSAYLPFFSLITPSIIVCNSHLGACACGRWALFILKSERKKISFATVYSLSLRISFLVLSYTKLTSLEEVFYFYVKLIFLYFLFFCNGDSHLSIFSQIIMGVLRSSAVHSCQFRGLVLCGSLLELRRSDFGSLQ